MKYHKRILLVLAIYLAACQTPTSDPGVISPFTNISGSSPIDSIKQAIEFSGEDTISVKALNILCWTLRRNDPDSAARVGERSLAMAERLEYAVGKMKAHSNLAIVYRLKSDYKKALEHNSKTFEIASILGDSTQLSITFGNFGTVYYSQGNYPEAYKNYLKALKMGEAMRDTSTIATQLTNIGSLYIMQSKIDSAIHYYSQALELDLIKKDTNGISFDLGGIASAYGMAGKPDTALFYYRKALDVEYAHGTKYGLTRLIGNMGLAWKVRADSVKDELLKAQYHDSALSCFRTARTYASELNDLRGEAINMTSIATVYMDIKRYKEAEELLKISEKIADSLGILETLKDIEFRLANLYDTLGNASASYKHFKKHIAIRDSLINNDKMNEMTRTQMNFEFEKERAVQKTKTDEEMARQQLMLNVSFAGGFMLLIVALISIRAYRNKKRSNEIISKQKKEVEDQKALVDIKQKEIIDSISYARRIQSALLTSEKYIEKQLKRLGKK